MSHVVQASKIDSLLQSKMANFWYNISCPIPAHPGTAVNVSISPNNQQFVGALAFTYTLCRPGWVATDYMADCKPCAVGYKANLPAFATACVRCDDSHYQPQNASTFCESCMVHSTTLPTSPRSARADCLCWEGYYALSKSWDVCEDCPTNALCTGSWASPYPQAGFWRSKLCSDLIECNNQFMVCSPRASCPGFVDNSCADGYCGDLCGICCDGYYHTGKYCMPCPDSSGVGYQIFAVVWNCLLLLVIYWKFRYTSRMGAFMILCNFVQVRHAANRLCAPR